MGRKGIAPIFGLVAACLALCGCSSRTNGLRAVPEIPDAAGTAFVQRAQSAQSQKIQHVVIVIQENRSFDDLFYGFPGANTATSGKNSQGQTVALQPVALEAPYGIQHSSKMFFTACDGKPRGRNCLMDAFDKEITYGDSIPSNPEYAYVPRYETKPYFEIARQYVLGDNMFPSNLDQSFESHQYIIAAQSQRAVDQPNGTSGCGGHRTDNVLTLTDDRRYGPTESPCFNSTTIADELGALGLTWRYYVAPASDLGSLWNAYLAIKHIYKSPEWTTNVISPPSAFLKEMKRNRLSTVTWIAPTCMNSDHASCLGSGGPDWVASVVNAVGESADWNSTAIFIMWDEWGGWYDHVPPPYEDYDGLGIRVPLIVVSPYAKKGYVSHVQYEHGSILRFIEDTFGLGQLAASDMRATSPAADCFDFTKPPRAFVPIQTKHSARDFIDEPVDPRPPDDD